MTWWLAAIVLFGALTALFLVALPAAFAFFGINIVGAWIYLGKEAGLVQLIRNGVVSITQFSLTPIPFFVLMGEVLFHTGLAMKTIDSFDRAIRGVPGRLAVVTIIAGTVFSAISGSTIATTAFSGPSRARLAPCGQSIIPSTSAIAPATSPARTRYTDNEARAVPAIAS